MANLLEFSQQLVNGLSLGAIYALIALGYTMVYGIVKLINFAHGDVMMIGAYAGFFSITMLGTNIIKPCWPGWHSVPCGCFYEKVA